MKYNLKSYNESTPATIHTYSVELAPYDFDNAGKVFKSKRNAVRYARSLLDHDGVSCDIVLCSFSYIVFHDDGANEFSNKRDALRFARNLRKINPANDIDIGFYDVTVENDIVCLEEVKE